MKEVSMDIRHFQTLIAIVKEEGFTKASKVLNYGQSTVTLHVKEIEAHYGEMVFDRIGKKVYLTPFGEMVYIQAQKAVAEFDTLLQIKEESGRNGVLRVGVFESLLHYRIQNLIQTFKSSCPDVDLIIRHGICNELRDQVRTGQLDLAFQIEPLSDFSDLISEVLIEERFGLILPKDKSIEILGQRQYTVYMTEKECTYRRAFERYLDQNGILKHQSMETGSVEVIKQYVGCGLGYSYVPLVTIRDAQSQERLNIIPLESDTPLYTQILYHKDKVLTQPMLQFLEVLRDDAKTWK